MTELTSFPYVHGHAHGNQLASIAKDESLDTIDFTHALLDDEATVKRAIALAYAIVISNYTGDSLIRFLCLEVLGDSKESWSVKQINSLADSQIDDAINITLESIPQSSMVKESVAAPNVLAYLGQDKIYQPLQRISFQLSCSID
jgi:hypothetical protein